MIHSSEVVFQYRPVSKVWIACRRHEPDPVLCVGSEPEELIEMLTPRYPFRADDGFAGSFVNLAQAIAWWEDHDGYA